MNTAIAATMRSLRFPLKKDRKTKARMPEKIDDMHGAAACIAGMIRAAIHCRVTAETKMREAAICDDIDNAMSRRAASCSSTAAMVAASLASSCSTSTCPIVASDTRRSAGSMRTAPTAGCVRRNSASASVQAFAGAALVMPAERVRVARPRKRFSPRWSG